MVFFDMKRLWNATDCHCRRAFAGFAAFRRSLAGQDVAVAHLSRDEHLMSIFLRLTPLLTCHKEDDTASSRPVTKLTCPTTCNGRERLDEEL
jgi:hypothetical protein